MHDEVFTAIADRAASLSPASVLEIGSRDVNGGVRRLFPTADHYHGIDIAPGPGVDEVADAAEWTPPQRYDVVVTTEVLEHAPRWADIVRTAWAALEPGGTFLLTCATDPRPPHSAIDGLDVRPDEHYANVDALALQAVFDELGALPYTVEHHQGRGDLYADAIKPTARPEETSP